MKSSMQIYLIYSDSKYNYRQRFHKNVIFFQVLEIINSSVSFLGKFLFLVNGAHHNYKCNTVVDVFLLYNDIISRLSRVAFNSFTIPIL